MTLDSLQKYYDKPENEPQHWKTFKSLICCFVIQTKTLKAVSNRNMKLRKKIKIGNSEKKIRNIKLKIRYMKLRNLKYKNY